MSREVAQKYVLAFDNRQRKSVDPVNFSTSTLGGIADARGDRHCDLTIFLVIDRKQSPAERLAILNHIRGTRALRVTGLDPLNPKSHNGAAKRIARQSSSWAPVNLRCAKRAYQCWLGNVARDCFLIRLGYPS